MTYQILYTALIVMPFLGIAALIETMASDLRFFTVLLGIAFWAALISGSIIAFNFLMGVWA